MIPTLNPLEIKNNFKNYKSEDLCQIIVCDRYLGINKELCFYCMEELAKRRSEGDQFDFELYINEIQKDLPNLNFKIPDFSTIIKSFK